MRENNKKGARIKHLTNFKYCRFYAPKRPICGQKNKRIYVYNVNIFKMSYLWNVYRTVKTKSHEATNF